MSVQKTGRVEGKVAIITGAASGIGRAAAILFAREGAKLALADMQEGALEETLTLVKAEGAEAVIRKTNVDEESDVQALIDLAVKSFGRIDIICNNAGIIGQYCGPEEWEGEDWQRVYAVNVLGSVYTIKHAAK